MFYNLLVPLADQFQPLNLFRYLTFRTGGAIVTSLLISFALGPALAAMFAALPDAMRGAHAATSEALAPLVTKAVRTGDVVTIKGSLASRMKTVVDALLAMGGTPRRAANG